MSQILGESTHVNYVSRGSIKDFELFIITSTLEVLKTT